ncbi:MAG: N-acetyl-gamma-glutamyl-phosphate reductase [Eubacteriales bacterium]
MIKASIIGCTGYAGEELTRILTGHKGVTLAHLVSKSFAGKKLSEVYGNYFGAHDHMLEALDIDVVGKDSDVVFTALPHGASAETIAKLAKYDVKIIDLSGDFRYDDLDVYEKWYKVNHPAKALNDGAVYGLTELYRDRIKNTKIVANPGCYTTCAILSVLPLLKAGLIETKGIIVDAKSGTSGAGRKESLALSFCETNENFKAYNVAGHRHTSEIEQELSKAQDEDVTIGFTPHLLPIKRGILETIYCGIKDGVTKVAIEKAYQVYDDEKFVHVLDGGLPEIKHVSGSNNVIIGFQLDERNGRLIVVSVIDNLIKGAAGQAVQNMNVMFNLVEGEGLSDTGLYL